MCPVAIAFAQEQCVALPGWAALGSFSHFLLLEEMPPLEAALTAIWVDCLEKNTPTNKKKHDVPKDKRSEIKHNFVLNNVASNQPRLDVNRSVISRCPP